MMTTMISQETRTGLCRDSLDGLSVGDALGAQFFVPGRSPDDPGRGRVPSAPWPWTDDTEMACVLVDEVLSTGALDQDRLALAFARRCDPYRGYGPGAVRILHRIRDGVGWREAAASAFGGQGSCGNGAAMRVAPLGAFHAGDVGRAGRAAFESAEITHHSVDGVAGAVAVAVAAAFAAGARVAGIRPEPGEMLDVVLANLSDCATGRALRRARDLLGCPAQQAAYELGNGSQSTAQDTVGFALWVADTYLADYPAAVATAIAAGGDMDTIAAIVGGVVAAFTGTGRRPGAVGVPEGWLSAREPLPGE